MDMEIRKSNSIATQVWNKLPFVLFLTSALILVVTLVS